MSPIKDSENIDFWTFLNLLIDVESKSKLLLISTPKYSIVSLGVSGRPLSKKLLSRQNCSPKEIILDLDAFDYNNFILSLLLYM